MEKHLMITGKSEISSDVFYYYLTEETVTEDGESMLSYGVEIRHEKNSVPLHEEIVSDICGNKVKVEKFIKMLCENEVMPAILFDIVYDSVQEGYFEFPL